MASSRVSIAARVTTWALLGLGTTAALATMVYAVDKLPLPNAALAGVAVFYLGTALLFALSAPFQRRVALIAVAGRMLVSIGVICVIVLLVGGFWFLSALSFKGSGESPFDMEGIGAAWVAAEMLLMGAAVSAMVAISAERRERLARDPLRA